MEATQFRTNSYVSAITRAANVTAYAALDVLLSSANAGFVFGAAASSESKEDDTQTSPLRINSLTWSGEINALSFLFQTATPFDFKVHLFTAPLTLVDNEAYAETATQFGDYKIGTIVFTAEDFYAVTVSAVAHIEAQKRNIDLPFNFKKNDSAVTGQIFAYIEVGEAWTPASAAVLHGKCVVTSD
jgi:hypothetical protein